MTDDRTPTEAERARARIWARADVPWRACPSCNIDIDGVLGDDCAAGACPAAAMAGEGKE